VKAWSFIDKVGLANLQEVERPMPKAGIGQVVMRMKAVALNYRDLAIARGHYHVGVEAPLVPLADGIGEVVAIGNGITRLAIGDLACPTYMPGWIDGPVTPRKALRRLGGPNDGTATEYFVAHEDELVIAPKSLTAAEAATLPIAAVTAWHSLFEKASVPPGSTVLVNGSGGVSTAAIQLARAAGARVIAVTRRAAHAEGLHIAGAHHVVVYADADWTIEVRRLARDGVDTVVDVAAGPGIAQLLSVLLPGGDLHLIGYAAGTAAEFDMFDAIRRAITIHFGSGGSRSSFEALVRAIDVNTIKPIIGRRLPIADLVAGYALLAAGGQVGKIVLEFAD
jgi:NADPH:quinone reductase-like Zn-dependent oxidoreductase